MRRRLHFIIIFLIAFTVITGQNAFAFWVWTPKSKTMVNPKFAVKDTPSEQYDWAMRFYKQSEFKRAAEEFERLTEHYPDSDFAPEAQYYAGRANEEEGKYYFAFQNYQKTVENYPYTKRLEEIIQREYAIANIMQTKEEPKLMDLELSLSLERATEMYEKIVKNNPFGEYADKALFKSGECYRRLSKYDKAIESYERIIDDYPESDLLSEAKYQLAYTKYEASLSPEYDQESTDEALAEFQKIANTTAVPGVSEEASEVMQKLRQKKAESTVKIAEFYERQGKFFSAVMYYKDVAGKFPETESGKYAQEKVTKLEKRIKK